MFRSRSSLLLLGLALAACGGASDDAINASAATIGSDIGSIAIDPGDGTLLAGSGPAFYRMPPGAKAPVTPKGALKTVQGTGTLTRDLVVRYAGPGTLVASGHSGEAALPANLGIVRSSDGGETWEPVSGLGKADYHEIEVAGDRLLALRSDQAGSIQLSRDGGRTFETREAPSAATPIDVAIDPADPAHWAVSTDQGTWLSINEGRSWRQRETTFGARIAWMAPDALISAGKDGKVKRSGDGGRTWQDVGNIGAGPKELNFSPKGELYASVAGGEIRRSKDRGATWSKVATIG